MNKKNFKKDFETCFVIAIHLFIFFLIDYQVKTMNPEPVVRAFAVQNEVVAGYVQGFTSTRGRPKKVKTSTTNLDAEQESKLIALKSSASTAFTFTEGDKRKVLEFLKTKVGDFDNDAKAIMEYAQSQIESVTATTNEKKDKLFQIEGSVRHSDAHRAMIGSYRKMSVEELSNELVALELHKTAINCLIYIKENDDRDLELVGLALRELQDEINASRRDTSFLKPPGAPDSQDYN